MDDQLINAAHYSQLEAQNKVEQIQLFQQELSDLNENGILTLSPEQAAKVNNHHQQLLATLSTAYDIDINVQAKQLTLGMKIASLLGALAMAISIFFLFYQFWGNFSTSSQVAMLIFAPLALFLLTMHLAKNEKNAYFSKISALVCLSSFVLNLAMLGQVFNISPSPNAFLVWSAFAFLLAYACNARLLLFFAITCISSFIAMKVGTFSGMYWISFGERPENFFIPSILIFCLPLWLSHQRYNGFENIYRVTAMIMLFIPILILANYGQASHLTWSNDMIEGSYQIIGFIVAALAIWLGIKRHWPAVINTGNIFFILFLYTKLFDWWWQWMPKYIFFFILGLCALLALVVFKRIRLTQITNGARS